MESIRKTVLQCQGNFLTKYDRSVPMTRYLMAAMIVILSATPVFPVIDIFNRIDVNRNGKIDTQEFQSAAEKISDKLDKNRDGYLDRNEFQALGIPDPDKLFDTLDANKDGRVSRDEFVRGEVLHFEFFDKSHMEWVFSATL